MLTLERLILYDCTEAVQNLPHKALPQADTLLSCECFVQNLEMASKNYSLSSASMGFKSVDQSSSLAFDGRYLGRKTVPAVNTPSRCFCHSWFLRKHRIRTIQAALPRH